MAKVLTHHRTEIGRQYLQFCFVGLINLGVDLGVYWVLTRHLAFFDQWQILAHGISFSAAVVNSYFLNSRWVFHAGRAATSRKEAARFTRFLIVQSTGLLISSGCFLLLTSPEWFSLHLSGLGAFPSSKIFLLGPLSLRGDIIAKFITAVVVSLWNFPLNKLWAFR